MNRDPDLKPVDQLYACTKCGNRLSWIGQMLVDEKLRQSILTFSGFMGVVAALLITLLMVIRGSYFGSSTVHAYECESKETGDVVIVIADTRAELDDTLNRQFQYHRGFTIKREVTLLR